MFVSAQPGNTRKLFSCMVSICHKRLQPSGLFFSLKGGAWFIGVTTIVLAFHKPNATVVL